MPAAAAAPVALLIFPLLSAGGGGGAGRLFAFSCSAPAAAAALAAPELWGFATWTRFPSFDVQPTTDGYRVTIADVRFGGGVIELDRELRPIARRP